MRLGDQSRALVLSTGRNSAWVSIDGDEGPRLAQLRRMPGKRSMPVPGDIATVRILEDGGAIVERIEPRSFTLARRTPDGRSKTMAANVDVLVTVTALADPPPRLATLDQLLAFAELAEIQAVVVFTKPDLVEAEVAAGRSAIYESLGYPTVVANPKRNENLDPLRELVATHRAMLAGNSGVGKSAIFRALGGQGDVGDVSRYGLGRQTTSTGRLYRIGKGFLIDSPGVSEFGLGAITAVELAQGFREIRAAASGCRFADCAHLREPGCAVLEAVFTGRIAVSRHEGYAQILQQSAPR